MFELVNASLPFFSALSVSLPRIVAALFLVPLFSIKLMRGALRYAIVIAIALPMTVPLIDDIQARNLGFIALGFIMLKEAMLGIIIGYLLAIPFWIFQSVGVMIDQQRGALSGGYLNPGAGPDNSMLGDLFTKVLVMLLISMGALPALFSVLIETYVLWPPLEWTPTFADSAVDFLIEQFGHFAYKFVLYSGPIVLVLLLVEAAFAILGAYTPQLQVYFIAMPAKALVALMALSLYFATLWYLAGQDLMQYHDLKVQLPKIFLPHNP